MLVYIVLYLQVSQIAYHYYIFQYRGLAPMYYRGAAAAVIVYDITSQVITLLVFFAYRPY